MAGGATTPHVNMIDDRLHLSLPDPDLLNQDPYRCPVSTPANSRRPVRDEATMYLGQPVPDDQMYVAFTNRCQKSQKNNSNGLQYPRRSKGNRQYFEDPMSKARHYYFIARIQPATLNAPETPVRSGWLNTLCSQPVEEIFVKYKRRLEASLVREAWTSRDVSTPGEKALVSAWSCNTSQRSQSCTPSLRIPTPGYSSTTPNSRMSVYSPVKGHGYESDPDIRNKEPEFALKPVVSSKTLLHKLNTPHRSSVSSVKNHTNNAEDKRRIKSSNDVYDKYKREPRRQRKLLPRRGNVYKLEEEKTKVGGTSQNTEEMNQNNNNNNLEQSTFEVVSFGASSQAAASSTKIQGLKSKNATIHGEKKKKSVSQGGKHPANECRFCMRDKDREKLPDISEKG